MDNTLQTTFNVKSNAYMQMPGVSTAKNSTEQQVQPDNKEKNNRNKLLLYSLGGLAVLGTAAYLIKSRMAKAAVQKSQEQDVNIMEVIRLRNKIKTEFEAKREPYAEKLFENLRNTGIDIKCKNIGELSKKIKEIEQRNNTLKESLITHRNQQSNLLKEKIQKLNQDSEWIELRKLRKNFINLINSKAPAEQKKIAAKKIVLVNDLLINKGYPEEIEAFKNLYRFDQNKGMEIVRTKFETLEDFNKAMKEAQTLDVDIKLPIRERNFTHMQPLHLTDIFPDEANSYVECNKKIEVLDFETNSINNFYKQYHEELKNLAAEARESADVKALRAEVAKRQTL